MWRYPSTLQIWALTAGGPHEAMLATGGGDASVVVWEDTTVADAKEQAEEEGLLAQREQELENAIVVRGWQSS